MAQSDAQAGAAQAGAAREVAQETPALLREHSCASFARVLAAKEPVPGGGGAAALVGALAAALASMAGNFTTGKPRYAACEPELAKLLPALEAAREELLGLIDQDAAGFAAWQVAYALPKEDPARPAAIEAAQLEAAQAPLAMMQAAHHVLTLNARMAQVASPLLASDCACAAIMGRAALAAAAVNVRVNTRYLEDAAQAQAINSQVDELLGTGEELAATTLAALMPSFERKDA